MKGRRRGLRASMFAAARWELESAEYYLSIGWVDAAWLHLSMAAQLVEQAKAFHVAPRASVSVAA